MCHFKDTIYTIIKDTTCNSIQIQKSLEISLINKVWEEKFLILFKDLDL